MTGVRAWHGGVDRGRLVVGPTCLVCGARRDEPRDPGGGPGPEGIAAAEPPVTSPDRAAQLLAPWVVGHDRERCVAAFLDTKHRLREVRLVSIGSLDHTFMTPREVYRDALLANAAAVVVAHNHPSGDPEPSRDDEAVTRRLARAGRMLGVGLLDHLVIAGEQWVSLARRGAL